MSSQRIEKILEKFYQGDTSLEEERLLREHFLRDEVAANMQELKWQFLHNEEENRESLPDSFDDDVVRAIQLRERKQKVSRRTMIFYVSGVAATVLLMISIFFHFNPVVTPAVAGDPDAAFEEASKVLFFVSEKLNQGTEPIAKIDHFGQGMDNLQSIKKFDQGMDKTRPVSKFNQITNYFTNPAPR
jgi:hypothetical protein